MASSYHGSEIRTHSMCFVFIVLCGWTDVRCQLQVRDVCSTETFMAKCTSDQVILITSGQYGRMRIGRCVRVDFGFVGCYTDVISILDRQCSGKVECQLKIPDPEMDETKPCLADLTRYLEVTYMCVPAVVSENVPSTCPSETDLPFGYLLVPISTHWSTDQCLMWIITSLEGQHINVTLFDFNARLQRHVIHRDDVIDEDFPIDGNSSKLRPLDTSTSCVGRYATIKDSLANVRPLIDICPSSHRVSHAYTSIGHALEIQLNQRPPNDIQHIFLLKYEVIGCPRFHLPSDYWIKMSNYSSTVGCLNSAGIWRLRCVNNTWLGNVGNCSSEGVEMTGVQYPLIPRLQSVNNSTENVIYLPAGLTALIVIILASGVGLSVTVIGLILINRCRLLDVKQSSNGTRVNTVATKSNLNSKAESVSTVLPLKSSRRHHGITNCASFNDQYTQYHDVITPFRCDIINSNCHYLASNSLCYNTGLLQCSTGDAADAKHCKSQHGSLLNLNNTRSCEVNDVISPRSLYCKCLFLSDAATDQ